MQFLVTGGLLFGDKLKISSRNERPAADNGDRSLNCSLSSAGIGVKIWQLSCNYGCMISFDLFYFA